MDNGSEGRLSMAARVRIAASVLGDKVAIDVFGESSVYVSGECSVVIVGIGSPALSLRSSWSIWSSWALEI